MKRVSEMDRSSVSQTDLNPSELIENSIDSGIEYRSWLERNMTEKAVGKNVSTKKRNRRPEIVNAVDLSELSSFE